MLEKNFFYLLLLFVSFSSCSDRKDIVFYYKFPDQTWSRFDLLHFEIPVEASENNYDVFLFVHHTKEFEFEKLLFNMKMTTPSGEEISKKYQMAIRNKAGAFIGQINNDSCEVSVSLKQGLKLTKGKLIFDLENLVPRLQTKGLLGIGVKLHPVR